MTGTYSRALRISLILHGGLLVLLVLLPLLARCDRKPKEEITFIELVTPAAPAPRPAPVTAPEPEPEPAPEPEPEPEPIPEPPPKPKPPKPKIQVNTNRIVRREEPKPPPPAPVLTPEQIAERLRQGITSTDPSAVPAPAGNASAEAAYIGRVQRILYAAWQRPGAVAGRRTTVQIRIARDGSLIQRKLVTPSGDSVLDDSVMTTLANTTRFEPLPSDIARPFLDITVHFESTGVTQ